MKKIITNKELDKLAKMISDNIVKNNNLLTEMSLSMQKFSDKLHSQIFNAFTNLACICIFSDTGTNALTHWAERATEPFMPWFSQDIKNETTGKRKSAVNKAFEMMFNIDYSAITEKSFSALITHYANRPNKHERLFAKNDAKYYCDTYKQAIVSMLEAMRVCIINRDYQAWTEAVNLFLSKQIDASES